MGNDPVDNLRKWRTRAYMGVALVCACLLIGLVLYISGILWQAVATVVVTALIAFLLHGIVDWFEQHGLSRVLGTVVSLVLTLVIIGGCIGALIPAVVTQTSALASSAPQYAADTQAFITEYIKLLPIDRATVVGLIQQASTWVQQQAGVILQGAAGGVLGSIMGVGNGFLIFFIALICSFWILVDLPKLSRELMSLFNEEQQEDIRIVTNAFGTAVYGWSKATLSCAIITGIVNGVAYWILGVPYSALLGVLCGILYFVPYIGPMISAVVVVVVSLIASPITAVIALVINILVNNIVANIISPKLMKSSVNVHPAIIMVVILIGGALGGMVGMLFSIPIAAAVQGVFITFYEERTGKQLATEDGALFLKPKPKIPKIDTEELTGRFHRIGKNK